MSDLGTTSDLGSRLLSHAREQGLFPEPGLALLAVSGGPDSVALLDLLAGVSSQLGLALALAHVDHGIATDSSDVAEQVLALAVRYRVPGHLTTLDLGSAASETLARRERYRALRRTQRTLNARYLVTAHQSDDQAETILFRALRGSGPAGLAGIPALGPGGLVRPLLPFSRDELRGWLRTRFPEPATAPACHTDPANFDPRHDRSWIRHRVLPILRERMGLATERNLLALGARSAGDQRAWAAVLRGLPALDFQVSPGRVEVARAPFKGYDKPLSEAILRALAREVGWPLGPRRAARLAGFAATSQSGRRLELGGHWVAEVVFDRLRLWRVAPADALVPRLWGGAPAGRVSWAGWEISWQPESAGVVTRGGLSTWLSPGQGEVRGMRRGDRVRPLGGVGHRRVCRVLMEGRVSWAERARYPILVREGAVVWVPGLCRSAQDVLAPGDPAIRIDARFEPRS